jgi:hypothetical protein
MAKGKRTIVISGKNPISSSVPSSTPAPVSVPVTADQAEAALKGKWVKPLKVKPTPQEKDDEDMSDTTHAQPLPHAPTPSPVPHAPAQAQPQPPLRRVRRENTPANISDNDMARLFPNIPAELRNNEMIRKKAWYYQRAEELGKTAAVSELSLLNLAENTLDGAVEGALSATEDYSDAMQMYKRWNAMRAKVKPQTDDTIKNKARQLNWFIKLGSTYGHAGKKFFNDVRELHERCTTDMSIVKDMRYTAIYENLNHIVRQQMMEHEKDANTPLMHTDDHDENGNEVDNEAFSLMLKPVKSEFETNLDLLVAAFKSLSKSNEDRADNPKKNVPPRTGFHDATITHICQQIQDYASNLDSDDKQKFFKETSPKKRGKKKAAPADSSVAAGTAQAPLVTGAAIPVHGGTHEEEEIPEGHYVDEDNNVLPIPEGYELDEESGQLVELQ